MKPRAIITYASVFCAGFAAAWALKKNAPTAAESTQELAKTSQHRSRQTDRDAAKATTTKQRTEDLLKKLDDAGPDKNKAGEIMSEMEKSELRALILMISEKAGFTGLASGDIEKLEVLVVEWSKSDLDAALNWAATLTTSNDRQQILRSILEDIGEKDLDRALEVAEKYRKDHSKAIDLPHELGQKICSLNAEEMLKRVARVLYEKNTRGFGENFDANYDYRKALDGIAALQSSLQSGQKISILPSNLIEQWAKHDPDAAWEWLSEGKQVPFNDMSDFFAGYSSVASQEELAQMLIKARDRYSDDEQFFRSTWNVMAETRSREAIEHFLQALPGTPEENMFLLFKASLSSTGEKYDSTKGVLLGLMAPQQRVSSFANDGRNGYLPFEIDQYSPILKRLGHSDAEIQQMLPKLE